MKVLFGPNTIMNLKDALPDLRQEFPQLEFAYCANQDDLPNAIADAEIYVGWLDQAAFLAAKKLKWIQSPSSGINYYFAIPEFAGSDVLLTSASGTHGACLAESTFAMVLAFTRGIRESVLLQQEHTWAFQQVRPKLVELTGSTMGIIGFGTFGRALSKRAAAFDMRVIAIDAVPANKPDDVDALWGADRLDDLLQAADYVVVAAPYTPQTANMLGAEQIALMKPTAMLVGMSRGGIIDQDALVHALQENRLAAAALDVFKPEPIPPDSKLWDVENLLITSHIAGGTQFETHHVLDIFRENLERFLKNEFPLRNQADKKRGF